MDALNEYQGIFRDLLNTPRTLYTAGIMLVLSISNLISGSFWSILVTEKLQIPAQNLAIFPFVRSAIILTFFFLVMPQINKQHFKLPMIVGFLGFVASQLYLLQLLYKVMAFYCSVFFWKHVVLQSSARL